MGSIAYVTGATGSANLATHNFSGQSIGAAAADRYIIVCASVRANPGVDGTEDVVVTIDGNAMTQVVKSTTGTGAGSFSSIHILAYPTGTTANFALSLSGGETIIRCGITIYAAMGLASAAPADTATDSVSIGLDTLVGTLTRDGDGFVIGSCFSCGNQSQYHTSAHDSFTGMSASDVSVECVVGNNATSWNNASQDYAVNTEISNTNPSTFTAAAWAYAGASPAGKSYALVMG